MGRDTRSRRNLGKVRIARDGAGRLAKGVRVAARVAAAPAWTKADAA